jgi:pyruvate ferredoxin oxidoreductase alpha subunit
MTEDADRIVLALGSTAGTAKAVADELRSRGEKVGVLKLRVFRPFPATEIARALGGAKAVAVLDRAEGFSGIGGPVFPEVRSALYRQSQVPVSNYVYGLGGRDIDMEMIAGVFGDLKNNKFYEEEAFHLGVRE